MCVGLSEAGAGATTEGNMPVFLLLFKNGLLDQFVYALFLFFSFLFWTCLPLGSRASVLDHAHEHALMLLQSFNFFIQHAALLTNLLPVAMAHFGSRASVRLKTRVV